MKTQFLKYLLLIFLFPVFACSTEEKKQEIRSFKAAFHNPSESAKPWVFWYWMRAAVSKEGITTDLEAMAENGIGGAYLMPIKGANTPPLVEEEAVQLTPKWWEMIEFAFDEAERLGLKLALHASDGFALAGGPWITPELSMQKVVWSDTTIVGDQTLNFELPQPKFNENYYKDIAVYAYPTIADAKYHTESIKPLITTSTNENADFLVDPVSSEKFRSDDPCWIQYKFDEAFVCRSIQIDAGGINYQAQRLIVEVSNDGLKFKSLGRLKTPRHGWQDTDELYTYSIPVQRAKYYRFVFDPEGSEPGAEDLDAAKWKANFKVKTIQLSGKPTIGGIEGKNGSVWRIAEATTSKEIPTEICIEKEEIINITKYVENGRLSWEAPAGSWTILRMGHTSTGHTNYTGGGGLGLEVDKFNAEAVALQYEEWFKKIINRVGKAQAANVLDIFHVDSWECGSQNWSPVFAEEFKKRRGYALDRMLPAMTGLPIGSVKETEQFLKDVRTTIVELTNENFYGTLSDLAHADGVEFSAECIAPTMTSDGLLHYNQVDIPMGEFWLRSPTHDKPNDALDALSAAHVYGKNIIQAEGFTELRMTWDEHPGMFKTLGDLNYAKGFNKFVFHVFAHNPWPERKPGMTLDPIGLFFQPNQTWWKQGKAWIEYVTRCQAVLQQGDPVVDIAVFTGEYIPRRSVLPEHLVEVVPGLIGKERVRKNESRLENIDQPRVELPKSVWGSANMVDPQDWIDPLNGYKYDAINPDALLNLSMVKNGKIVLPGGAAYSILVFPGKRKMDPEGESISGKTLQKVYDLIQDGATVLFKSQPKAKDELAEKLIQEMFVDKNIGNGKLLVGAHTQKDLANIQLKRDADLQVIGGEKNSIAWNHRKTKKGEVYFISNQNNKLVTVNATFRVSGFLPELLKPVNGQIQEANEWKMNKNSTNVVFNLDANQSIFVVFETETTETKQLIVEPTFEKVTTLNETWNLKFEERWAPKQNEVEMTKLKSWTELEDYDLKHYSGTVKYFNSFKWSSDSSNQTYIQFEEINNLATVYLNNQEVGVLWTKPYNIEISDYLQEGLNELRVEVSNTWANRLIGDHALPEEEQMTWTMAPYILDGEPLLPAGLMGEVSIIEKK